MKNLFFVYLILIQSMLIACKTPVETRVEDTEAKKNAQLVARVLNSEIAVSDLTGATESQKCQQLATRLTGMLFEAYRRQNNITASSAEIAECQLALTSPSSKKPFSEALAESIVVQYKIDRQLYQTYGGKVVFQQASPLQPVGAYVEFLREHEKTGSFQILDASYRDCFWKQFSTVEWSLVPESEVDFSEPWWKRVRKE